MAYRNANGKITIDEHAAQRDIRKLKEAIGILETMKEKVRAVNYLSNSLSGEFAKAQAEKSVQLENQIKSNISALKNSIYNIETTLKKYKALDQKIKSQIKKKS